MKGRWPQGTDGPGASKALLLITIALSLLFFATACERFTTPVSDILNDPGKYENRTVLISGKVLSSQKLSSKDPEGSFVLDDGTGQIKVITRKSIPAVNKKVFVKGRVKSNFVIFGKHFGVVVREE